MVTQEEVNVFLDGLRESGVTNMFGAGPYIEREFSLVKGAARKMLVAWMETFEARKAKKECQHTVTTTDGCCAVCGAMLV